jgi:tetratricopeptide (TPR) repeat protein
MSHMSHPASCKISGFFWAVIVLAGLALLALFLHAQPARAQVLSDGSDADDAPQTGSYHWTPPSSMQQLQNPAGQPEVHSYHYSGGIRHTVPAQDAAADAPVLPKKADVPFRTDSGLISAEYYLAVGKYAEALSVLKGVLTRHPDNADAYTYRGYAYEKLGDLKKAEADYRRALLIDPRHLGANRYIASLYLRAGDLQRALEQLQVIRMVCGPLDCQEQDDLEAEINKYKSGQKDQPPAAASDENDRPRAAQGYNR